MSDESNSSAIAKEQQLATLQTAPPPPPGRPRPSSSTTDVLLDASDSAATTINPSSAKEEEPPPTPSSISSTSPPTKILTGTRVINSTTYEFTCTATLNLASPLESVLVVTCISEYFDEYSLTTTARAAQERLIQVFNFDQDNYRKSTQYVIHHTLKILTINKENQLVIVNPPVVHDPVPDRVVHGATVMQARARGMLQRKADMTHGVVTVEFSTGSLGIELEDRPEQYGACIYDFTKDTDGEIMAAEESNLLERGMVVLRVGDKEAVGEKFRDVLTMIRIAKRPMTVQFAFSHSKVLRLADSHFGPRARKKKKSPGPKKTLRGTRSINDVTYDFTCTAELDLEDPLQSVLVVDCTSEYYDEYQLITTAGEVQERLIQLYPFDADNYQKSTKYTIHHSLKVYTIREGQLIICDPPEDILKGAAVIQARARGMMQRKKDQQHGVVDVEFSSGPLGIHLEDRPGKYGASIHDFTCDENGDMMAAESSGLLKVGMVVLRVGDDEAVGEKFQNVLTMLRAAKRPVEIQFGYEHSKVLKKADRHFGARQVASSTATSSRKTPIKKLAGTRTIQGTKYDFECNNYYVQQVPCKID